MTETAPVGATVQKRCTCGGLAQHRGAAKHPRYVVVGIIPNRWAPPAMDPFACGWAHLRRIDTGRVHRTSLLVLRDALHHRRPTDRGRADLARRWRMTPDDPRIRRNHRAERDRAELIDRRIDRAWALLLATVLALAAAWILVGGLLLWIGGAR